MSTNDHNIIDRIVELLTPWRVAPLDGKYYGTIVTDIAGNELCRVWKPQGRPSEREMERCGPFYDAEELRDSFCDGHHETDGDLAIARLFSAAPDLLEALKECLREHGGYTIKGDCQRKALAAISKAGDGA